jgi:hypothetical protein
MKTKKKVKLSLDDLKVQSFVTSLNDEQQSHLLGGDPTTVGCTAGCTQTPCWTNCKKTLAC